MTLFQPSTPEAIEACRKLVECTVAEVRERVFHGQRVHFIWDVDFVLVGGRSDDMFALLGYDVGRYQQYESRLLFQPLEEGPWAHFADRCGDLHFSQDIVTARQGSSVIRSMFWLVQRGLRNQREHGLGSQSKAGSYRDILSYFRDDPHAHVYQVDDGEKHVRSFREVAAELGMTDRTTGILAPKIRMYDEAELKRELDLVMNYGGRQAGTLMIRPDGPHGPRHVVVTPNPRDAVGEMLRAKTYQIVEAELMEITRREQLGQPPCANGEPKWFTELEQIMEIIHAAKARNQDPAPISAVVRECGTLACVLDGVGKVVR